MCGSQAVEYRGRWKGVRECHGPVFGTESLQNASVVSPDTREVDGSATGARLTPVAASAAGHSVMPERIIIKMNF